MKKIDKRTKIIGIIVILAFLGFLDSTYLTLLHYQNVIPPCAIKGCEIVITSKYSTITGVPIALFGSIFFVAMIILPIILLQTKNKLMLTVLVTLAIAGFNISLVLFLIQAFVLKAYCQYCLLSELISVLLLIFSVILLKLSYKPSA